MTAPLKTCPPPAALSLQLPQRYAPLLAGLGPRIVHASFGGQKAGAAHEPQPYWQYLEKQNRRHDVRADAPGERPCSDPVVIYAAPQACRPAGAGRGAERGGADPRPGYAMPALGDIPRTPVVRTEERISVQTLRQVMAANGRLIDAMA